MCVVVVVVAGEDESVLANLKQYSLESRYVDMMVADAARYPWREGEMFDAILTDRKLDYCSSSVLFCFKLIFN